MNRTALTSLLRKFKEGSVSSDEVIGAFAADSSESLGFAVVDHGREIRQGFTEVVLAEGKTDAQVAEIARSIVRTNTCLLVTRATRKQFNAVKKKVSKARYNEVARTISANEHLVEPRGRGRISIVTAGTSDLPVAAEAYETALLMGNEVDLIADVGVAGIHRVLSRTGDLRCSTVVVVVAGMEGALPSVVGGLVDVPVIAVPTSVGYGASFGGISALLGMLNSCSAGVTVVNIDNGFGAGFAASLINRKGRSSEP